jgi:nucleotide-binding universal stress UspA family protein
VDLSEFSFTAVGIARNFVPDNANIHVVHVVRELNPNRANVTEGIVGKECSDERPKVCRDALEERLANEYPGIQTHVEIGEPAEAIAKYAASIGAELIVMTSHGRKGMKEHLIGSVAERVVRFAKCSIVTIKPQMA